MLSRSKFHALATDKKASTDLSFDSHISSRTCIASSQAEPSHSTNLTKASEESSSRSLENSSAVVQAIVAN
jgi:hypothetical protein